MGSRERLTSDALKENQLDEETVSGCFDFRLRTRSFDLHQVAQHRRLKKLGFHFKSESDTEIKTDAKKTSSTKSLKNSSQPPSTSRRFVRVVRDSQSPDLENPHVIHRFSQDYIEHLGIERANSFSEGVKPKPYVVKGHTILKKQTTTDKPDDPPESPSINKHAKFFDEVMVIEFDKECTIRKDLHVSHREKLHDEEGKSGSVVTEETVETVFHQEHGDCLSNKETKASDEKDQILADEVFS